MATKIAARPSKPKRSRAAQAPPDSGSTIWFISVVGVIVAVGALAVLILASSRTRDTNPQQTAAVELSGDNLTTLPAELSISNASNDPAAGEIAPTLVGTDFEDNTITIEPDGRPKVIYFLAHWCPVCQAEVPVLQQLIADGQLPADVDVYAVSTGVDLGRGNYPPESWLETEGFEQPTLRDDVASSAFVAYGGSGFPYGVYLDADHKVIARSSGQVPEAETIALWNQLAS
jgi:thiol-disulfide isomerase/thioredoxin